MADGKTHVAYHNKFWIFSVIGSVFFSIIIFRENLVGIGLFNLFFVLNYWIAENLISPDLDLISISGQDGRLITAGMDVAKKLNRLGFIGKIIGFFVGIIPFLFSQYSALYSYTMQFLGGHRNIWSHSPVLSTAIRMIWFNTITIVILGMIFNVGVVRWNWTNYYYELYLDVLLIPYLASQFLAWSISDCIHLILDSEWAKGKLYEPKNK